MVYLRPSSFSVVSITISKGETIILANDQSVSHYIRNGQWVDGNEVLVRETGAPLVETGWVDSGQSVVIGPFNTAGTYHVHCIIHTGMNLIVVVQ
jgi:plastocyanin